MQLRSLCMSIALVGGMMMPACSPDSNNQDNQNDNGTENQNSNGDLVLQR